LGYVGGRDFNATLEREKPTMPAPAGTNQLLAGKLLCTIPWVAVLPDADGWPAELPATLCADDDAFS
jgi:hypothetical protein